MCATASSTGMMFASLKNAACSTMFERLPRPIAWRLPVRVDDVEVDVVVGDVLEDLTGDVLLQLALRPLAVEQEAAVRLELVDNVVFRQVRLVVAGDEVGAA